MDQHSDIYYRYTQLDTSIHNEGNVLLEFRYSCIGFRIHLRSSLGQFRSFDLCSL